MPEDIAVVGWACRLPGANSIDELWTLLQSGECSISRVPADRFPLQRFGHPQRQERGRSYTWAAGTLDRIWDFDPSVFGISPREAVQMDPQQRLLLQLTWEALEDAGIPPSTIAGTEVGVYIGACQVEYGHRFGIDHAVADSHFATGTALSVVSNRLSYVFDLHGPSMTIDTACSSSLVALHQAVEAIRSGRIDTAIVGGVNIIDSPSSFIAFSQASMLSPSGRCQAFSANADGFVRAEGAGVLILRHTGRVDVSRSPIHGFIVATEVNSDGRTSGISLPSLEGQQALLNKIYRAAGVDPARLAFVEAHGTGTPVGDPIEATALGRVLGAERDRSAPLLIGSIKTNIGHLEAAAGMAGLFKAFLALKHQVLPASLQFDEPNPHIEFEKLNLAVCNRLQPLARTVGQIAGVNSFGFGGTNAHAIIAPGREPAPGKIEKVRPHSFFMISAETKPALAQLAADYSRRVEGLTDRDISVLANAAVHRREHLGERAVVIGRGRGIVIRALEACASDLPDPHLVSGAAIGKNLPVAFVYSGNGSQWAGMARAAFRDTPSFAAHFRLLDSYFAPIAGWSLSEALFSEDLAEKLALTSVAQPLLFAIQSAITVELRARGLSPVAVLGHSVGEVAAAEAAGIIDTETAVKLVFIRSMHQHRTRGMGRMMVVRASAEVVDEMVASSEGVEIAAINSPRTVTIAGSDEALIALGKAYPRAAMIDLNLDYPFHTRLMESIKDKLISDLGGMVGADSTTPFISTVTGKEMPGVELDAAYWWRNIREPVKFSAGVRVAAELGARVFVEIGPRSTLLQHIEDVFEADPATVVATLPVFQHNKDDVLPFERAVATAMVKGAGLDLSVTFGPDPGPAIRLPGYPWQQREFRFQHTSESFGGDSLHLPLVGMRYRSDATEWYSNIDTELYPELRDHRVGSRTIFPGSAFIEIAASVARQWLDIDNFVLNDFQLLQPLDLTRDATVEIRTRVSPASNSLEIASRPRLSHANWITHARCVLVHGHGSPPVVPAMATPQQVLTGADIYRLADDAGLHYGPQFKLVEKVTTLADGLIEVRLAGGEGESPFVLDPMRADCCGHGILSLFPELRAKERGVTYIPVRSDRISIYHPYAVPVRAIIEVTEKTGQAIIGNYYILDADNRVVSYFHQIRGQAITTHHEVSLAKMAFVETCLLLDGEIAKRTGVAATADDLCKKIATVKFGTAGKDGSTRPAEVMEGWARSAAYEVVRALAEDDVLDPDELVMEGRLPAQSRAWLRSLLVHLETLDLVSSEGRGWRLRHHGDLPASREMLNAIDLGSLAPAADLTLAGWMSGFVDRIKSNRALSLTGEVCPPDSAFDFYEATNVVTAVGADALMKLLDGSAELWPDDRAVRILVIGHSPLTRALLNPSAGRSIRLTVLETNRRSYDRARAAQTPTSRFELLDMESLGKLGSYDLIVSAHGLARLPASVGLEKLVDALAPGGVLLATEQSPSLFADLVFGTAPEWFGESGSAHGRLREVGEWKDRLSAAGFQRVISAALFDGPASVSLIAAHGTRGGDIVDSSDTGSAAEGARQRIALVVEGAPAGLSEAVLAELKSDPAVIPEVAIISGPAASAADIAIVFDAGRDTASGPVQELLHRCNHLKDWIQSVGSTKATIWLVFRGALSVGTTEARPVETGAWAFSRVLSNEFSKLDLRRLDISPDAAPDLAARHIRAIVRSGTNETELHSDGQTIRAVRIMPLNSFARSGQEATEDAVRLQRRAMSSQRVAWEHTSRVKPQRGEVEIAVAYAGINFRDLMWTLSLLPDEMLEDGFAGAALGLECSGHVVGVGPGVKDLRVGDRVIALAANSLASHVTAPVSQVAKIPGGLDFAAAATIPVAYSTAYYSLVKLAKLSARETVLIHGGAGAVGLAAIQLAKWRGAKIIATAGSTAKRELLAALGVDHVLDSRSTKFVEEVLRITGDGVDVVLNSLAGEAMAASIDCLRPFGRFVELGKRDYIANTNLGLRPFRRNLSYFGVDLDQLMVGRRKLGKQIFGELMRLFERRVLTPLPFSTFRGDDIAEAFQLMQQSHHVGKIVVQPPASSSVAAGANTQPLRTSGTHVITGAFGGFGMEVAKWLVEQGVRSLALFGRSGAASPEARMMLEEFKARGVEVLADPLDVSDKSAVVAAFAKISETMQPVTGIMHAAMVLDDAIVANLNDDRFLRVLAPKVQGAENLDAVSRDLALDYFVFFSSITTIAGHHGQGNYVAANAYMEGFARNRRLRGLPALAIAWGIISDVGVAAKNERARKQVVKLTTKKGMSESDAMALVGMPARDALNLLGQALSESRATTDPAVLILSSSGGRLRKEFAAILRSPTYKEFVSQAEGEEASAIDLRALLMSEDIDSVRRKVTKIVVDQLGRVLHARPEDISRVRPMAELGLDSLMTLELAMDLESAIGINFSMERSVGSLTIPNLVDEIIAQVSSANDPEEGSRSGGIEAGPQATNVAAEADAQPGARLVA
ncbi:MAG: SDR family NAD(P)-dependent oxidoreductase [Enhydrobacter sp.]|nr:SDR family NAD(P)-dependent oxidoreductase [Enhydrobacter sp.]